MREKENEKEPHIIFHIRLHSTLDNSRKIFQFSCWTWRRMKERESRMCGVCIFHIVNKTYIHLWNCWKIITVKIFFFPFRWQNTESMLSFCWSIISHEIREREREREASKLRFESSPPFFGIHLIYNPMFVRWQMTIFFQDSIFFGFFLFIFVFHAVELWVNF
jgi:hypothetical protein